jgi:hypothetical protein
VIKVSRTVAVPAELKPLAQMQRGMLLDRETHQVIRPATAKDLESFNERGIVKVKSSEHGAFVRADLVAPPACHDEVDKEGR